VGVNRRIASAVTIASAVSTIGGVSCGGGVGVGSGSADLQDPSSNPANVIHIAICVLFIAPPNDKRGTGLSITRIRPLCRTSLD
jgi:hypothetical protein